MAHFAIFSEFIYIYFGSRKGKKSEDMFRWHKAQGETPAESGVDVITTKYRVFTGTLPKCHSSCVIQCSGVFRTATALMILDTISENEE